MLIFFINYIVYATGTLDKLAYGADRSRADGNVLMNGESSSLSTLSIIAPTPVCKGRSRKTRFLPLASEDSSKRAPPIFSSTCLEYG